MTTGQTLVMQVILAHAHAMERGVLSIWTIYDKPKDYPEGFIARRYEVGGADRTKPAIIATSDTLTGSLEHMRNTLERAGLTVLRKHASDHANVVESWI